MKTETREARLTEQASTTPFLRALRRGVARLLGRERANRITAPYYDWAARRRTRHTLATLPAKDLRLHIGCGTNVLRGWVNLDMARGEGIDVVWDIRRGLPFPNNSCSAIFGEHIIEHLPKASAEYLTGECYRVLQPKGVLRLSTPDAGLYLRSYAGDGEFLRRLPFTRPAETLMDRINHMMREDGQHLWTYDAESLMSLLNKVGFSCAERQEFGRSVHPLMRGIDSEARAFESLYVEAVK